MKWEKATNHVAEPIRNHKFINFNYNGLITNAHDSSNFVLQQHFYFSGTVQVEKPAPKGRTTPRAAASTAFRVF